VKVSNNVAKIRLVTLKLLGNTLERLKNCLHLEKNKPIRVCENERSVVGALVNGEVAVLLDEYIQRVL